MIPSHLVLARCRIEGTEIVSSAAGVPAPRSGLAVTDDVLTTRGEYSLTAANTRGVLTVTSYGPGARTAQRHRTPRDPGCHEGYYNLEGGHWTHSMRWRYNWGTKPGRVGNKYAAFNNVRTARNNMSAGINNCGLKEYGFSATGDYVGGTNRYPNVDSKAHCTGKFPDGENVQGWQDFQSTSVLGATCVGWNSLTKAMIEADSAIRSNGGEYEVVSRLPSNCLGRVIDYYDLQTVSTHEWGHAYGLAHEHSGPDE